DSGKNRGKSCTVDGQVNVTQSLAPNKLFHLSKDCPPIGAPVASLNIPLAPTTNQATTPGTGGSKPCRQNEATGVPAQDDACGPAGCGSPCTGNACVRQIADPSNPGGPQVCVDSKGGISQVCCNSNSSVPCFQTRPGGPGINRTGHAAVPA